MWIPDLPGSLGPSPREGMREAWTNRTSPRAMLAALREELGEAPSADQVSLLIIFANRCARQMMGAHTPLERRGETGEHMYTMRLLDVVERRASGMLSDEERYAVRLLGTAVARGAAKRLADPARRGDAALILAAFNALDPDPYAAALQASGIMERHGARDEREAEILRYNQGAWLHQLFGRTILADRPPPPPEVRGWKHTGKWVPEQATSMRYLLRHRDALLAIDPWIPVPQDGCAYAFGTDERPLPIGALCLLWDGWEAATGDCPECGGQVVGYAMGGMSRVGGVIGCCLMCERELRRQVGGLATVAAAMGEVLAGTGFEVSRMLDHREGVVAASREELDAAVRGLVAGEVLGEG